MVLTGVCSYCSNTLWGNGKDSLYSVLVLHHPQRNSRISKERCRNEHLPPPRAQGLVYVLAAGEQHAQRPRGVGVRPGTGPVPQPAPCSQPPSRSREHPQEGVRVAWEPWCGTGSGGLLVPAGLSIGLYCHASCTIY